MRTIKFRGWNKVHGGMTYGLCSSEQRHTLVWSLMQYTGLTDKNGVEIYEGDIVKYLDDIDGETKLFGFIEWERAWWSVDLPWVYFRENDIMDDDIAYEVIGNLYETPDLIAELVKEVFGR
jgi:uncharacterized phage protein (TIGR01671 family)